MAGPGKRFVSRRSRVRERQAALVVTLAGLVGILVAVPGSVVAAQEPIFGGTTELCDADWVQFGNESAIDPDLREVRVRAEGTFAQTHTSNAEVGMRFIPSAPMTVPITFSGIRYNGLLRGGAAGTGRLRIRLLIRNLTTDEIVDSHTVADESDEGSLVNVVTSFPGNTFNPATVVFTVDLQAGHEYVAVLRAEAEAKGVFGRADLRSGGFHADMGCVTIENGQLDQDGDGLLDEWETNGIHLDNDGTPDLPLHEMGADPLHKDLFIELDWLPGQEPTRAAIAALKEAFASAPIDAGGIENPDGKIGINLWVDTGDLIDPGASEDGVDPASCEDGLDNDGDGLADGNDSDCPLVGDDLEGGNEIPLTDLPNGSNIPKLIGDTDGDGTADFYVVKANHFSDQRALAFRYGISGAPKFSEDGAGFGSCFDGVDNGGDGLIDGADVLDCFGGGQAELGGNDFIDFNHDPGTLMHEIGHNLNLRHGGDESVNCKPNYVSVMNYDHQAGIPVVGGPGNSGQDLNGDNTPDGFVIDFSPPRFPGGRGAAPLPLVDEAELDETQVLDPTDIWNMFVYSGQDGAARRGLLAAAADWTGDGVNIPGLVPPIDLQAACSQPSDGSDDDELTGHDDWTAIQLPFLQFGNSDDGPVNPVEEREPTRAELDDLREQLNTADLEIEKTGPDHVMAGQAFDYEIVVSNLGPNPASEVHLVDVLPDDLVYVGTEDSCAETSPGIVECSLGEILDGESKKLTVTVRAAADIDCRAAQLAVRRNRARVENLAGPDPVAQNNRAVARTGIVCRNFEYAAKIACGTQLEPQDQRLAPGLYAATVSIHNPNDEQVFLFKKLALTFPPAEQAAGQIHPIALDTLAYDEALKTDCNELRDKVFGGAFPDGYIEGFVVVQSPVSLDVVTLQSTAGIGPDGAPTLHSSLHMDRVPERRVERTVIESDLVPDAPFPVNDLPEGLPGAFFCGPNGGKPAAEVSVRVHNLGPDPAGSTMTRVVFDRVGTAVQSTPPLDAGEAVTLTFDLPENAYQAGSATFRFIVDDSEAVAEVDEQNNTVESFCTVVLPG